MADKQRQLKEQIDEPPKSPKPSELNKSAAGKKFVRQISRGLSKRLASPGKIESEDTNVTIVLDSETVIVPALSGSLLNDVLLQFCKDKNLQLDDYHLFDTNGKPLTGDTSISDITSATVTLVKIDAKGGFKDFLQTTFKKTTTKGRKTGEEPKPKPNNAKGRKNEEALTNVMLPPLPSTPREPDTDKGAKLVRVLTKGALKVTSKLNSGDGSTPEEAKQSLANGTNEDSGNSTPSTRRTEESISTPKSTFKVFKNVLKNSHSSDDPGPKDEQGIGTSATLSSSHSTGSAHFFKPFVKKPESDDKSTPTKLDQETSRIQSKQPPSTARTFDNETSEKLAKAIKLGDLSVFVELAKVPGMDFNQRLADRNDGTLLHLAATEGQLQIVKFLVKNSVRINVSDGREWTPLHSAAVVPHPAVFNFLLEKGGNSNNTNTDGNTCLHYLVRHKLTDKLQRSIDLVIKQGCKLDLQNVNGDTALHYAVQRSNSIETVRYLLRKGANTEVKNKGNLTPLACAIAQKKTDIEAVLRQFEDSKKNGVDAFKEFLQTSAADASPSTLRLKFHNAVKEGDIQLVTEMLNAIDYVDFMQPEGKQRDTALHVACRQGNKQMVQLLIQHGAVINARDNDGWTPLHCACSARGECPLDVITFLIKKGHPTNVTNVDGNSCLHYLVRRDYNLKFQQSAEVLLNAGAFIDLPNNGGDTPLHTALLSRGNRVETCKYLKRKGASTNIMNSKGFTPIQIAMSARNEPDLIDVLLHEPPEQVQKSNDLDDPEKWQALQDKIWSRIVSEKKISFDNRKQAMMQLAKFLEVDVPRTKDNTELKNFLSNPSYTEDVSKPLLKFKSNVLTTPSLPDDSDDMGLGF